ncbi:MAG: ABC-2 family transporter protein, partial [Solobacterium sp.]|nr:ABC-2 family transporter protein [Solobacterium sp.]
IYSILFSEAIDTISIDIRNGKMYYSLLKPLPLTVFYIAKNLNLKSLVITPFLIVFNVYCLYLNHISLHIMNFLFLLVAVYSMGVIFLLIICLDFIGLRSEAINPIMVELLELRDRPDKIFNTFIRSIFIYIIPIYLTSAIPTKMMIENCNLIENIYFFLFPVIGTVLSTVCIKKSIKYYTFGTEEV